MSPTPVDNCVDKPGMAWIDSGYHVQVVWSRIQRRCPHCGEVLLRGRGRLWIVDAMSTQLVDSFGDAQWRPWIARRTYPQPSTFIGDAIPPLPRAHPHHQSHRRINVALENPEFLGDPYDPRDIRWTYPHYPPALLLRLLYLFKNKKNKRREYDLIQRRITENKDIHSKVSELSSRQT